MSNDQFVKEHLQPKLYHILTDVYVCSAESSRDIAARQTFMLSIDYLLALTGGLRRFCSIAVSVPRLFVIRSSPQGGTFFALAQVSPYRPRCFCVFGKQNTTGLRAKNITQTNEILCVAPHCRPSAVSVPHDRDAFASWLANIGMFGHLKRPVESMRGCFPHKRQINPRLCAPGYRHGVSEAVGLITDNAGLRESSNLCIKPIDPIAEDNTCNRTWGR
jgi:hypothetical protein